MGLKACTDYLATVGVQQKPTQTDLTAPTTCQPLRCPVDSTPCDPSKIFVGKLNEGDTCTSSVVSYECKPGLRCSATSELGDEGECVRLGQEGDLCSSAIEDLGALGATSGEDVRMGST